MVSISMDGREMELRPTKIICLLRSYAAHASELSNPVPDRPRFFLKPPSSLLGNLGTVIIPSGIGMIHHEVELALIMGRNGRRIPVERALDHIMGYTIMLDITARDLQDESKKKGLPWTQAKGYDTFAPVGPLGARKEDFDWRNKRIWLKVNGEKRQDGNTSLMLFPVERMVSEISSVMTLEPGDIILTGTPEGVGPLEPGDEVEAGIDGLGVLKVTIAKDAP